MKYLTLELIHSHLRIDSDIEDTLLVMYAESAEDSVLNDIGRSYEEVVETYGAMPKPLMHATLLLVDLSYKQRGPIDSYHMSVVPYGYDRLVKPYIKLVTDEEEDEG